jgi:hypothetical protein
VQVRLARDWTDTTGNEHAAGDLVEVDTITLAELEATGVVVPPPSSDEDQHLLLGSADYGQRSDPDHRSTYQ